MKSPFTFKRYMMTALVISVVALVLVLLLRRPQDPMWLALLIAPLIGFCLPFNVWFVGEIAWRGSRSARLHDIPLRNALIRLAAGLSLIILSLHIPVVMWEFDEEMIAGVVGPLACIMIIYAVGQLIGIGMNRKDRTSVFTVPK
jgi:hypothetical protein